MKPEELDVVRPLPRHNLLAGARGTVVMDYTRYSDKDLPPAYEVEFADADGVTQALVTLSGDGLEVDGVRIQISRLGRTESRSRSREASQLIARAGIFMSNSY
jgi:hypothetical protein